MVALTIHVEIELSCARVQAACEAFARNFVYVKTQITPLILLKME